MEGIEDKSFIEEKELEYMKQLAMTVNKSRETTHKNVYQHGVIKPTENCSTQEPEVTDCNQTYHEIDITNYRRPQDDSNSTSLSIDPNDPFDEAQVNVFLSRLDQPLEENENYITINGDLPKITVTKKITLGKVYMY